MLHYEHAGIAYQENSASINTDIASFASLPGELRNLTYASTLKCSNYISFTYNAATQQLETLGVKRLHGRTPVEALKLLSNVDHSIRAEARSYLFANNFFEIETRQSLSTDPHYIAIYIKFLDTIGEIGRRSLQWLQLTVKGDSKQHRPTADKAMKLWELIGDCANLSTLDVYAEIDYFYMDQPIALTNYMSTEGYTIGGIWSEVLRSVRSPKNLKRIVLRSVFSSRWCYSTLAMNGHTAGSTAPEDLKEVRFVLHRPIDEATSLSEQIKGYVRRDLRGSVGVRVFMTENWNLHGADVLIGQHPATSDKWQLKRAGRCKPFGCEFNYRNWPSRGGY
jgi:hypothetical protein